MADGPDPLRLETTAASILRARYRCTMCHKHCMVPCRFTLAEFRALERALSEAEERTGVSSDGSAGATRRGDEDPGRLRLAGPRAVDREFRRNPVR